jgi:hypothetical protein
MKKKLTAMVLALGAMFGAWAADDSQYKVQLWAGGPYWATTNIGADKPEDYGYYFWWGDTIGYKWENGQWVASDGSISGFLFADDGSNTLTWDKDIATLQNDGWITSDVVLALKHDAAHVHWGGDWRMPTDAEISSLVANCTTKWITTNGVLGRLVTGKGAYADRSIFLPAAGYGRETLAYPDLARDILNTGKMDEKKLCLTCGKCTEIMRTPGGTPGCPIRDGECYLPIYKKQVLGK